MRKLKGVWIPAEILLNKDLSDKEKIILAIILYLSEEKGSCFASNKYIASIVNVTHERVSKIISSLNEKTINKIIHARWDIENDGFNELKNQWNMKHCYIANENAIDVILQMIVMSYNLWELYIYGHLHNFEKMKITKIGFIEEIKDLFFANKCKAWYYSSA